MKLSLMGVKSENGVIGAGSSIPWKAKGEQQLFKAHTYNYWLIVGRKTFEDMGVLPNRKYAVISRSTDIPDQDNVIVYSSIDGALAELAKITDHAFIAGGGQIYKSLIDKAEILHLSTVHMEAEGDVYFPEIPKSFTKIFSQYFESNINYTYEIWSNSEL